LLARRKATLVNVLREFTAVLADSSLRFRRGLKVLAELL
jgi:hypothetical protein